MNSITRSHSKSQVPVRCMRALGCAYRKLDSDRGSYGWWLDETTKYGTGRVTPNLLHNKPNLVHVIGAVAFEPISFSQPPHHSLSRVRACRRQDSRFQGSLRQEGAAQTKRPTQPKSSDDPPRSNNNNKHLFSAHLPCPGRRIPQTRFVQPRLTGPHIQAVAQCPYARSARLALTYRALNIHVCRRHSQHAKQRAPSPHEPTNFRPSSDDPCSL